MSEIIEFPKWLYHKEFGAILFNSQEEVAEAGSGWVKNPGDLLEKKPPITFSKPIEQMSKPELIKACRQVGVGEDLFQGKEKAEILEVLKASLEG